MLSDPSVVGLLSCDRLVSPKGVYKNNIRALTKEEGGLGSNALIRIAHLNTKNYEKKKERCEDKAWMT